MESSESSTRLRSALNKAALVVPTAALSVILLYLVIWNLYYSFTDWSLFHSVPQFVGFLTYAQAMSTLFFRSSFLHSFELSGGLILVGNLLGIFLAGLLYFVKSSKLRTVYLSIFIAPLAISMAVNGVIWLWLFNLQIGIDWLLVRIGLPALPWLSSTATAFPSMFLVTVWAYTGLAVLFYLASFMGVDKSLIEAARVDGVGSLRTFFKVLLPNSSQGVIVATALLFLFSFKIFSLPFVLSGGPTNVSLQTGVIYMYYLDTTEFFAESTAIATLVTAIAAAVVIPFALLGLKRWVRRE
ncbi:glycerol-3-phosphate ABC transporter permease [Sulfodiicoccus acidiphilus]|nr:glucose ABC transporter permease GlcT [Sulfodiicoccus acidiphilus]BBD73696.1 glycerol-3-phosphate ABC transporter permease [Sulfodiicoccus acidiphilus]